MPAEKQCCGTCVHRRLIPDRFELRRCAAPLPEPVQMRSITVLDHNGDRCECYIPNEPPTWTQAEIDEAKAKAESTDKLLGWTKETPDGNDKG